MAHAYIPSLLFLLITFAIFVPRLTNAARPSAIFIFGDSTADVGTNTHVKECGAKADHHPYGQNFPNNTPTGRWSNGKNTVDFLSKLMLPFLDRSPEPYILQESENSKFETGANFASGGSGLLNDTNKDMNVVSMFNQTEQFIKVRNIWKTNMGEETSALKVTKSIFLISVGSNDIIYNFKENKTIDPKPTFIKKLTDAYEYYIEKLYEHGARKFGVISVIAMGCCPAHRIYNTTGGCLKVQNEIALDFYDELSTVLKGLKSKYCDFDYSLGNTYEMMMNAMQGKSQYSLPPYNMKVLDTACCGSGKYNADSCDGNASVCENPLEYAFWDGYHPTQAACHYTAYALYFGNRTFKPDFVSPKTFMELASDM